MVKKQLKIDLIPAIRRLEVTIKGLVSTHVIGTYKSAFKGSGLEFEDYREYSPSDDASLIDWKASARSDRLLIKQYIEERNLSIFFLIDVSDKMVFGSTDKLKNEYTAELVASLAYITLQGGDKIGFSMFSDKPVKMIRPERGMNQFYALAREIVNPNNYGGEFDFNKAMDFLLSFIKQRSLVIIVSDFVGLEKGWEEKIKLASNKFDVIAMIVKDPRDFTMPDEDMLVMLSNPEEDEQVLVNPRDVKQEYEKVVRKKNEELKDKLTEFHVDYVELLTEKSFVNPIMTFFRRRHDKWR